MYITEQRPYGIIERPVNIDQVKLPEHEGIYLMADTAYDVKNKKLYYLLKVGYSRNLYKRRKDYSITAWVLDYKDKPDHILFPLKQEEAYWHKKFKDFGYTQVQNTEWFIVEEKEFLDWAKNGFGHDSKLAH